MRVFLFLTFGFIAATLASESEENRRWGGSWSKPKYPKEEKESMSEEEIVRPEVMPFPRPKPYPRPYPKPRPSKPFTMYPRNFYYLFRHICRKGEIEFPTCERFEKIWIFATSCDEVNEGNFNGKLK